MLEPVAGERRFQPLPAEFLKRLRLNLRQAWHFIGCDEVQSGFARTGNYLQ